MASVSNRHPKDERYAMAYPKSSGLRRLQLVSVYIISMNEHIRSIHIPFRYLPRFY